MESDLFIHPSRLKSRSNPKNDVNIKRQCQGGVGGDPNDLNSWPGNSNDDDDDDDSIFCNISLGENTSDTCKNEDIFDRNNCEANENEDDNNNFQCTQKFIDDIRSRTANFNLNKFDISSFIHGSQYQTREELKKNRSIVDNKNISIEEEKGATGGGEEDELQNLKDFIWTSQEFFHEGNNSIFPNKGPFYDLPIEVKELIQKCKGIKDLYEWQKECLQLPAVHQRKNLLYALPTSGGKTLVAEILILREIICREKNALLILPYVSIVQEKVSAMSPFAIHFDFLVEEYAAGRGRCPPPKRKRKKSLFIASIEKGAILFDSLIEAHRVNDIGLVVIDELHLIGERGRGAVLESLLTKIIYLEAGIQVIGMSATIGNLPELSDFLNADIYTRGFRPVELREYIKCGDDILHINNNGECIENIFSYNRTVNFKYSESVKKYDPDHLAGLVSEVIPQASCLVFCSSRKSCENVALILSKILPKKKHLEYKKDEKNALMDSIEKLCGTLSTVLKQTIPYGVAFHHSGLTTDERKLLETAYRFGTIYVICCTSTLAAGVNLPAKRVIIRAPYVGQEFITLCQYKQMVGRAGRAGFKDAGESILICSTKDNLQVAEMLFSPMDKVISSMDYNNSLGLHSLILSTIGLNIANCLNDVLKLVSNSLLAVQAQGRGDSINSIATAVLRDMFKHKILQVCSSNNSEIPNGKFVTTQEVREKIVTTGKHYILSKTTKFDLTMIGKAAFKAGVHYKNAECIYHELKEAQKSLVLTNYTHLLYLVVSFNLNDEFIKPDTAILFKEYNLLNADALKVAQLIGISEAYVVRMAKTKSTKGPVEIQLNRFYRVLILNDVINLMQLHEIAAKYSVERGIVQSLITQSLSAASSIIRLCEQIDHFWCYKSLFEGLMQKLDHCCTIELEPLLELPSVKVNRARQLYSAGYRSIEDIAKAKTKELVDSIEYMSYRNAREIISAAKMILLNKLETLQEETENILECLQL